MVIFTDTKEKTMKNFDLKNKIDLFEYFPAQIDAIGILSIPHSGEILPDEFKKFLIDEMKHLSQDVDYRVHELIDIEALNKAGINVIKSNIIRTAIDLNRPHTTCLLNWKKNSQGVEIVKSEPSDSLAQELKNKYYAPYFEMLKTLIDQLSHRTSTPNFIDLHSMPSKATDYHLKVNPNQSVIRPDFCISDQTGKTCSKEFIATPTKILSQDYTHVSNNDPYFGGHITVHIDKLFPHSNNIQIEISRGIYMNEQGQHLIKEKVDKLKPILTQALIKTFQEHFQEI